MPKSFVFSGKTYNYKGAIGERVAEVPIVWDIIKQYNSEDILEVGNVLGHYFKGQCFHDVVDRFEVNEKFPDIINEDTVDFNPVRTYKLVVSISTLEHVGRDDGSKDPRKILSAIENMKSLCSELMVVTLPMGYNKEMDAMLRNGEIRFAYGGYLKRITLDDNVWVETSWKDICYANYNDPFPAANGLVIGYWRK